MLWGFHIPIIAVIIEIQKDFLLKKKKEKLLVLYPFEFSYIIRETQF